MLVATAGVAAAGGLWFAPAALADNTQIPGPNYGPCSWNDLWTYGQDNTTGAIYRCENIGLADPYWMLFRW
jgi:hypothetical protein